jgi:hypothetical protein
MELKGGITFLRVALDLLQNGDECDSVFAWSLLDMG